MDRRISHVIVLGTGLLCGAAGATLLRPRGPTAKIAVRDPLPAEPSDGDDEESLAAANANLVRDLQDCNRKLGNLGDSKRAAAPPTPAAPSASGASRAERRAERGPADWERLAKEGVVPYSVPCIRDTPFTPSPRQLDRLGLAPNDADVLRDAYGKSNERLLAQIKPLCSRVLGNDKLPDRVGAQACISAIIDGARKDNPDKMQEALARVGEVNAGKRPAPREGDTVEPVEALMLAMTNEAKTFESELTASLGPDDAHRVASRLCTDRGTARAKPAPQ